RPSATAVRGPGSLNGCDWVREPGGSMATSSSESVKDRVTSLDTLAVVRELRSLGRARVDKAFDVLPSGWSVVFRVPSEGRRELVIVPGRFAAVVEEGVTHAEELGPLSKELRRLLSGAVLTDVRDPRGERYLEIELRRSDTPEPLVLAAELFGTGNLLVARGDTIVAVAHAKTWAHRAVRVGAPYLRPPNRTNPWAASEGELAAALRDSRTDRATTLAARLSFGGPVAEEVLLRAGVSGEQPAPMEAETVAPVLHRAIAELLAEVGDRPRGFLYRRAGMIVDVEPYPSKRWRSFGDIEEETRPSFSLGAVEYFSSLPAPAPRESKPTHDPRAEFLRTRERQETAILELTKEAEFRSSQANAIYSNYDAAEKALEVPTSSGDPELLEVELAGMKVPLVRGRTPRESAQRLYEESKRVQGKLSVARQALAETEAKLNATPPPASPSSAAAEATAARKGKPHWFEKHRWFVSSEGVIVIGGRDAASNDLIVRRYLNDRDLYVHADIHGAASVIVKQPPPDRPPAGPPTMQEAAQWAVAFSKAWRAGLGSASAFWVTADQVSKAGASGEFVARGAWVIHGTKNILRDLPTELGIGTVHHEGADLWTVAPPVALQSRGTLRFILTPGDERERGVREVELSKLVGLSRDRLQSLLPAGGITFRRA
ncbi:MAG: NFACT family protein, partial [Thermoplasmata archaeon]|nr:NFACT family protein [Thermoplasmata archaeon]